ncbi:MAG: hypothetical protein RJB66_1587 [Pseudomonadota bacterium]|jgi:L-ascorbate metabolism protein UlaG (beta-lactamase superfamily)
MALRINRILHAGYFFADGEHQLSFDPIFESPFSRNCFSFPSVAFDYDQICKLKLDAVFISHYHDDHCSLDSLKHLDRSTPIFLFCLHEELFEMIKTLGFKTVEPIILGQAIRVGEFTITPWRALDAEVDSIFQIQHKGINILNVVDSWIDPEVFEALLKRGPWDLVLWPFQTMRELEVITPSRSEASTGKLPQEWLDQLQCLKPRILVPSSCQFKMEEWSWYNKAFFPISYQSFKNQVLELLPHTKVVRMNPSVGIELQHEAFRWSDSLEWVKPIGNQDVDYVYDASLVPPKTSELAHHFGDLSEEEKRIVFHFLEHGLKDRFEQLVIDEEGYFFTEKIWQLNVYQGDGTALKYCYRIQGGQLEPIENLAQPVNWFTEIIMARLYGALSEGESLSSLYLRINDCLFEKPIEETIKEIDPLEDPLLRVLYTGAFASYQKAQLSRLLSR